MSIVKQKDKRTGITYVYESVSYWDKEKKQPRSKRTLIGKVDEETGEIVPTGRSGRKKSEGVPKTEGPSPVITDQVNLLAEKDAVIAELKAENARLKKEKQQMIDTLNDLLNRMLNE